MCTNRREHRTHWWVVQYRHHRSAFNGYRPTPSPRSLVRCTACGATWRTGAAYVDTLPHTPPTPPPTAPTAPVTAPATTGDRPA